MVVVLVGDSPCDVQVVSGHAVFSACLHTSFRGAVSLNSCVKVVVAMVVCGVHVYTIV